MKKIMIALVALLMTGSMAQAQDAKAKDILEKASKKMNSLKTLKAGFTLKVLNKGGKLQQTSKGNFLLKGEKYHITVPDQEIISDGKTVWTYMAKAKEVQVSNVDASDESFTPAKLFTNFYDKDYKYRYIGARKIGSKSCEVVELTPSGKNARFSKAELAFDAANTIAGGNIFEKNGSQYQYEVGTVTPNPAITDAEFSFDTKQHPGVEVVDLR
jgi:outer membrane lipoprotein carrier protein